uniref:Reverse transcriptase domain-containing protein n=1 Tax=Acanthochromis polyacanthus TaxID=80966 RepID=A0A3Q1EXS2_9TELE
MSSHYLVLGGDFNCWLSHLDRSSNRPARQSNSSKVVNTFLQEFSVIDAWRFLNPSRQEYTFFSPVHHTYTRIDYFLLDRRLIPNIRSCSHGAIVISDHSPLTLDLVLGGPRPSKPWRFNTRLLSDEKFVTFVTSKIDLFVATNETPSVSPSLLWETFKAFIRGHIISYSSFESRERRRKKSELMTRISQLDSLYATSPSPTVYNNRLSLQAEFDCLSSVEAEEMLLKAQYAQYEYGEKATKLLSHQLRSTAMSHLIPQIQTSNGISSDPQIINDQFKKFYSTLYTSEYTPDSASFDSFFDNLNVPTIDQLTKGQIEESITPEEVIRAIGSMQSSKCPGPDGFPVEFYKKFIHKLAPLLLNMFTHSFEIGSLPPSLLQASISLILKKDKDPLSCNSYRPISLLNVDYKILAKLLAIRLETVLPGVISPDQTGFIKGRYAFSNLRRLFNVVYNSSQSGDPECVISLDAEKAFDRVEWGFLFYVLQKFGFGRNFILWVKLLYTSPLASVKTNNTHSDYFPLFRGTRQGCPMSPLLFALAIEPLAISFRSSTQIIGITRKGIEQRVSLYADDLLLYISKPNISVPSVLSILHKYGCISGYKLNLSKSELFPLNLAARHHPLNTLPFQIVSDNFTYLGVKVTEKFKDLFKFNFTTLLEKVCQDLDRWSLLHLSVAGRINTVKMNVLPRFSFLFQCIPIFIPVSFFQKLDGIISRFVWSNKTPRIRKAYLQRPKITGGMALPNFLFYYWACNIRILHYWIRADGSCTQPAWLHLEISSCIQSTLPSLIYAPKQLPSKEYYNNIIIKNTLKIWYQFRQYFKLYTFSLRAPISKNPAFPPSIGDAAFKLWSMLGIKSFNDLYIDNTFASFQQLSSKFCLPKSNFFRYLQIRSFIKEKTSHFPTRPPSQGVDMILSLPPPSKGLISYIYERIHSFRDSSIRMVRITWEQDLGFTIQDDAWEKILFRVHKSSLCARHGLIQCKILHQTHWTKLKLSRIFPNVTPDCNRCHQAPANSAHMFWSCPSLQQYWTEVFAILSAVLNLDLHLDPLLALFGIVPITLTLPKFKSDFIAFLTLLARRRILLCWKSPLPPLCEAWIRDVLHFSRLEKIKFTIHGSTNKFLKIWQPFFDCVQTLQSRSIPP